MDTDLVKLLEDAKNQGKAEAESEYAKKLAEVKTAEDTKAALEKARNEGKEEGKKEAELALKTARKTGYHNTDNAKDDNDGTGEFLSWVKTGDVSQNIKTALVEGVSGLGGVTVPNAFQNRIAEKYTEASIMRQLNPTVISTSHFKLDIPRVATGTSSAAYTAEAGGYDEQEPILDSLTIQVYKMTQFMKVSDELLNDTQANLEQILVNQLGAAFAATENTWFFAGNGSNQAYGVLGRAGLGVTAASTGTITAAELNNLLFALPDKYADAAKFVMQRATLGKLMSLTGNPFLFMQTPQGNGSVGKGPQGYSLLNTPVYQCSAIEAVATGKKSVVVGDFSNYYIIENGGLVVTRNPYLYMANGQVGIFATRRVGGDLVLPESVKYLVQA